jgi:hypothetical protein
MRHAFITLVAGALVAGCGGVSPPARDAASVSPPAKESLWQIKPFDFPQDALSCNGKQLVQFNERYNLYVGLILCNDRDEFRLYLSSRDKGPFLPATDTGGHGQDHCELVNKNFALPNSDNINSGGCISCSTSRNLPLEHVDTWARSNLGTPFRLVRSGTWAHQTSRLRCGVIFEDCGPIAPGQPEPVCVARAMEEKR